MKIKLIIICVIFFKISFSAFGQNDVIYLKKQTNNIKTILNEVEKNKKVHFFFEQNSFPNDLVEINTDSIPLISFLQENLSKYKLKISTDNNGNYFILKDFTLHTNINNIFNKEYDFAKNTTVSSEEILIENNIKTSQDFISKTITIGKNKYSKKQIISLSGIVFDIADKTPVNQVKLTIVELKKSVLTNKTGFYEFKIPPGTYTITISSMIMHEKAYKVNIYEDGKLNIPLQIKSYEIDEITISANQNDNVKSSNMGFEKITAKAIKELPSILGEKDIVKVALLLPGVQTIGELSSGFNVRGSPSDQNVFYINNMPIYNSSHVFGLFTAFNGDAISEFKFYKSNLPIEYGGHLSSIFDIEAKKGNKNNFSARGGIGLTSARVLIEGPLWKEKISYIVSLRSSYSDWLLSLIKDPDVSNSSISFYDALININGFISKNNKIDVFAYNSNDLSDLAFGIKNEYSNIGASLKWTHSFSDKFKSECNFINSKYSFTEENSEIKYLGYKHSFDLNHNEFKLLFKLNISSNHIKFGVNSKYYKLNTGDFLPLNDTSSIKPIKFEGEQAISNSLFIGDKWDITDNFSIEGGIRYTLYSNMGAKTVYSYEQNSPRIFENIADSTLYKKNEIISNSSNLDYKLSGKYQFSKTSSIKASYSILHQYIFMLSNTVSVSPTNRWKLSDSNIKPMRGEQYSLGFYKNIPNILTETYIEVYYKTVSNLVEYKDGAVFLQNRFPETNIIQGDLNSYGLELMLKKKVGKLNGWINYTYSSATVKAFDSYTQEMNNSGLPYPANYDRPHAFNFTLNYKLSKRVSVSTNIIYSTGRPVTYPTSIYYLNGIQITAFSSRNEYRIPDYFRTDLAINIEGNLKKYKFAHSYWSISFYNITSRKNPYSITFQNEDGRIKAYKVSILGTIIPSITYNLKFGNYEN